MTNTRQSRRAAKLTRPARVALNEELRHDAGWMGGLTK